jgi:cytochrome c oxidase subunit I+III
MMFLFFNVAFFPMHISGLLGMPRRVYTYPSGLGLDTPNLISSVGAFGFAAGVLLLLVNLVWSLRRGPSAGRNPWDSDSLEWLEPSPPPAAQFVSLPVVRSRHPLWSQPGVPEDPDLERKVEGLTAWPTGWRGALVVSPLEAKPVAIAHVPGPTIVPFTMAVAFLLLFSGALIDNVILLGVGGVLAAVALVAWFRPQRSESRALSELGAGSDDPGRLPLAVGGPIANGYYGMLMLMAVLATALATTVSSYFYLVEVSPRSAELRDTFTPGLVSTVLSLLALAGTSWSLRGLRKGRIGAVRLALAAAFVLNVAALGFSLRAFPWTTLDPHSDAYASSVLGLLGFHWVVLAVMIVVGGIGLAWALRSPQDPRGHGVAHNANLMAAYTAADAAVVFAAVFLSPGLM